MLATFVAWRYSLSAPLGQADTQVVQRMHSVPFVRLLALSVMSTFIGQTFLHLPQETHFVGSTVMRTSE
jgi:hypothetical protein